MPAASLMQRHGLPPEEIERRSLALVEAAIPACSGWTSHAREVVKRMVYAAGDLGLAGLARMHPDAVEAGLEALRAGAPIVCDVRMVAAGLRKCANPVHVAVDVEVGEQLRVTRCAAGVRQLSVELNGGIALIGNAPTALLALLDMVDEGRCQPALVIATPVGFVAAAESKQELVKRDLPYVTVEGTRGGSPLAAAALNALLILAGR
ncbi:MAG: precorrin-8X methylmutase [Chloroflexota bacterium]